MNERVVAHVIVILGIGVGVSATRGARIVKPLPKMFTTPNAEAAIMVGKS